LNSNLKLFFISDYRTSNGYERAIEMDDDDDDSDHIPSDIDSQVIKIEILSMSYQNSQQQSFFTFRCHYRVHIHCHASSNLIVKAERMEKVNILLRATTAVTVSCNHTI
jgi:hypothetical protein